MIYNLNKPLLNHRGEPIKDGDTVMTLGGAIEQALIAGGEPRAPAKDKLRQYKLAQRVAASEDRVEFSAEEVSFIKELAVVVYSAIGYGAIDTALENPEKPVEVSEALEAAELPTG